VKVRSKDWQRLLPSALRRRPVCVPGRWARSEIPLIVGLGSMVWPSWSAPRVVAFGRLHVHRDVADSTSISIWSCAG
jgi:hypothetical protein